MTDNEKTEILKKYDRAIYKVIYSKRMFQSLDRETVETIANDIRFRLWRNFDKYNPEKSCLTTWVYHTAKLVLLRSADEYFFISGKQYQRRFEKESTPFSYLSEEGGRCFDYPYIEDKDAKILYGQLINTLKNKDRDVMELYFRGYTQKQIAEKYGVTAQAVSLRTIRCIKELKEAYNHCGILSANVK